MDPSNIQFSWSPVTGSNLYWLQLSTDANFTIDVQNYYTNNASYQLSLDENQYYWHVVARNYNDNWCHFSDTYTFIATESAGTQVSGEVYGTWSIAGSPYFVVGDITVPSTHTLTIEPGVEVRFNGNYYLDIDGGLVAEGTSSNQILFTSNQSNPSAGDWGDIQLSTTILPVSMAYCRVE